MLLIMVVSMYSVRVVLATLGLEDYGVYGAIGGLIASLSFVTSVLANACQRFFSVGIGKKDNKKLADTFSMMFWLYVIAGIFAVFLFGTIGQWFIENKMTIPDGRMDASLWVFHFMILSFVVSLVNAPFQALIVAHERMSIYAYIGILDVVLKLVIVFILQWGSFDKLKLYSVLLFGTSIITTSIYVIYSIVNFAEARVRLIWNSTIFKDVFAFSSWTLFGSVSFICNTQGINLLLNVFFGPVANAAYSIGNQVKSLVNQFSANFYSAVRPPLMKAYAAKEYSYVNDLFFYSSKFIFISLFVIAFPVFMNIEFLLAIWLDSTGEYMSEFVRLMLIYAIILSISDPITTIIQAADKVKMYYLIVDTFTLLTLPITYVAYKNACPASLAFYISIAIFWGAHFIRLWICRPLTGIKILEYSKKIILPIGYVVLVSVILSSAIRYGFEQILDRKIYNNIVLLGFDFVVGISTSFYIFLSKSERLKLINMIKKNRK